jgi:DivIVA domain-containing protein
MPMWIILGVCAAVFVLVVAVAGSRGVFDGGMGQDEPDLPRADRLPAQPSAADLADVRFTPVLWGYRPAEVDRTMDVLRERIAQLEARSAAGAASTASGTPSAAPGAPADA